MIPVPTIGWSDFARKQHNPYTGLTYTTYSESELVRLVKDCWLNREPGYGEGNSVERKVVVPLPHEDRMFFTLPQIPLQMGVPLQASVTQRQEGEDPYIETFAYEDDIERLGIKIPIPDYASVVVYHKDALVENNGTRTHLDCDWEIVAILATIFQEKEPMRPLTMARNFLAKTGGTVTQYTATEFAEAIYYHGTKSKIKVKRRKLSDPPPQH